MSHDCSIDKAPRSRAGPSRNRGSIPGRGKIYLFSPQRTRPVLAHQASYGFRRVLYSGVKRPGIEADHSPPSTVEINNHEAIPSLPIRLHSVVLN
jgi:hypothetical protein